MIKDRIIFREFKEAEIDTREVLRYAGVRGNDESFLPLLFECQKELSTHIRGLSAYRIVDFFTDGNISYIGNLPLESKKLAEAMAGSEYAVIFAATLGIGVDRAIAKQQRISTSRAHMMSSIANERIESLCDELCRALEEKKVLERVLVHSVILIKSVLKLHSE